MKPPSVALGGKRGSSVEVFHGFGVARLTLASGLDTQVLLQ